MEGLNRELAFQGYPDSFETARQLQRSVTPYVGPPNSGKTHGGWLVQTYFSWRWGPRWGGQHPRRGSE